MQSTTRFEPNPTITHHGSTGTTSDPELIERYDQLTRSDKVSWTGHHRLMRMLGRGGQGEVYLTEYRGTDGFTVPVAMKIFSPERYADRRAYDEAMGRVASIASSVALIQHDNLLDVQNFFERDRIRIMMMEWVDGYDLRQLTAPACLDLLLKHLPSRRWDYINEVTLRLVRITLDSKLALRLRLFANAWPLSLRCTAKASCMAMSNQQTLCSSVVVTQN